MTEFLKVKVKVGRPDTKIVSKGDVWEVHLKSRAKEGKANIELVKLVSRELGKKVKIVHGFKAREKILK